MYPIIKHRNVWFTISGIIVAISAAVLFMFPIRLGIDFTGGSLMNVEFTGARPAPNDMRTEIASLGYSDSLVQNVGSNGMLIRMKTLTEDEHQKVLTAIKQKFGDVTESQFESVGPSIGSELRQKAMWSLVLVLVAIALYVAYAFRKVSRPVQSWKYGVTTLLAALCHDVLIPLGVFAYLGHAYYVEVNSAFIAAMLTVLGFSVHDTIVVFDRVRENLLKTGGTFEEIVERSVNETLARSINTTVTALIPLFAILLWGGETLRYFALALIIGLFAGTYSSIFLASPILVVFQKRSSR